MNPARLGLILNHVDRRDDAAGAVAEQEHRQVRLARFRDLHGTGHVGHVLFDIFDKESFAVRFPPAAQIEGIRRVPGLHELLGDPDVLSAVRIDAMTDDDHGARLRIRPPGAEKDLETTNTFERLFNCGQRHRCLRSQPSHPPTRGARTTPRVCGEQTMVMASLQFSEIPTPGDGNETDRRNPSNVGIGADFMSTLVQDFRYALRALIKSPGFAATAIVTLALGIGATTAMFSVVDGVLLKPLRYRDADRIVAVSTRVHEPRTRDPEDRRRRLPRHPRRSRTRSSRSRATTAAKWACRSRTAPSSWARCWSTRSS